MRIESKIMLPLQRQRFDYSLYLLLYFIYSEMKSYKDGPVPLQDRSCTDVVCLIIFLLFTVVMLGIGVYSWTNGNFKRLTTAYDPDGKGCGVDYPSFPYIYFASPHTDSLWVTVCVSKCPVQGDTALLCQPNSLVKTCLPVNNTDNTLAVQIYDSSLTANTLCLPTSDTLKTQIASAVGGSTEQITSLMQNYTLILLALPIAIILSLVIMVFIRLTAGCFIYLLIILTVATLVAFGVYILTQNPSVADTSSVSLFNNPTAKIIVAVVCFLLAILIIVMMCCFKKRINLASSIVKVSARFVASNCGIVLIPILMFIVMVAFIALWILQALGYYSLGTPKTEAHQYPYQHFDTPSFVYVIGGVHIFYLLWSLLFLVDTGNFLIGGAACSWYYQTAEPYTEASARYRKKHIGSVCMGSFFLALLGLIKFIYELLTPEQESGATGCMASYKKFCDCICCCCTSYLFQTFNSGALTGVNLTGESYCSSASTAFSLKLKNLGTSSVVAIIQVIFTVLIRLGITFLTVLAIYLILTNVSSYSSVQDPTLILIIVGLVAFAISCFFIAVYSEGMESIYTTYLYDVDAGGSMNKCPEELKEFLEEAQKGEGYVQK